MDGREASGGGTAGGLVALTEGERDGAGRTKRTLPPRPPVGPRGLTGTGPVKGGMPPAGVGGSGGGPPSSVPGGKDGGRDGRGGGGPPGADGDGEPGRTGGCIGVPEVSELGRRGGTTVRVCGAKCVWVSELRTAWEQS